MCYISNIIPFLIIIPKIVVIFLSHCIYCVGIVSGLEAERVSLQLCYCVGVINFIEWVMSIINIPVIP